MLVRTLVVEALLLINFPMHLFSSIPIFIKEVTVRNPKTKMANRAQDMSHKAGEMVGQAQMKRDEILNQGSRDGDSIANQASNFLHQTGEQVKSMAHGAAEAVKNTLGMNTDNNPSSHTTTLPSYNADNAGYTAPAAGSSGNHPSI